MTLYAAEHASALDDIRAAGARVTFTLATAGTYDEATDTWSTPVESTVAGYAIQVQGDPRKYERLTLIESEAPSLLFAPDDYGAKPALGSSVEWAGESRTTRDVGTLAPDGTAILAEVVVE